MSTLSSNRNTRGSWHGRGRGGRGRGSKRAVYEAETTHTSKSIVFKIQEILRDSRVYRDKLQKNNNQQLVSMLKVSTNFAPKR